LSNMKNMNSEIVSFEEASQIFVLIENPIL